MNPDDEIFGSPIYSYSRSQAIEDGVLVDLSFLEISRQHWKIHIAASSSVWAIIEDAVQHHGKDLQGVLHDLYTLAKIHIKPATPQERIYFNGIVGRKTYDFILHVGPGDTPVPCLTLMLPSDD